MRVFDRVDRDPDPTPFSHASVFNDHRRTLHSALTNSRSAADKSDVVQMSATQPGKKQQLQHVRVSRATRLTIQPVCCTYYHHQISSAPIALRP